MSVKSVYNFVPAPKESEVFTPDWADKVSHDIPFSDGESGEIELKITAETPIFIRNGHSKEDAELFEQTVKDPKFKPTAEEQKRIDRYLSFSNYNGKYFIPATSLKGMFRNVLEIMSLARLETKDDVFPLRNLENQAYKNAVIFNRNIKSGWLQKQNDGWVISECDHKRIPIKSIEEKYSNSSVNISFKDKTAIEKYKAIGLCNLDVTCYYKKDLGFNRNGQFVKTGELYDLYKDTTSVFEGKLVFYGSMANKKYEYVFNKDKNGNTYEVPSELFKKFKDINKKAEASLWSFFQQNKIDEIPVLFFAKGSKVEHFGFSRLYKLPNVNRLHELNPIKSYPSFFKSKDLDLTHTIFGATLPSKDETGKKNILSQKGRVFFSHGHCIDLVENNQLVSAVLSSPKPSYFPFYLKNGKTYLNDNAELSGFKKYPLHNSIKKSNLNEENVDIQSQFIPLGAKTTFKTKIRFHNLKKVEIGALLSAITFHGNSEQYRHSLGGAKPLGYGKVQIDVTELKFLNEEINEYLKSFEEAMEKHQEDWLKSDQIQQLFGMAQKEIPNQKDENLEYPELEYYNPINRKKENEFLKYKKLPPFQKEFISIQSIVKKMTPQPSINLSSDITMKNIEQTIKEFKEEWDELSDENKDKAYKKLIEVYNTHAASKRRIDSSYVKKNIISEWLGENLTSDLYKEIQE